MKNDWRQNGNGPPLYENLSLILNGVSTNLTSISLQKVLTRFWIFFWPMLEYLPMCGSLKSPVSVLTSVLFSNDFSSKFKFRYCFVTLLISLVGNWFLFKIYVKFSKSLSKPFHVLLILQHLSNKVLMRPFLYLEN